MDTGSTGNICRVCRAEGSEDNPLFYPCKCAGSIRYVHEDCLKEWLKVSKRSKCELCNYPIQFRPVYSPAMPKRLPLYILMRGIGKRVLTALRSTVHTLLVFLVWLLIIPNLCAHCFRPLFQQEDLFVAVKRFVLFGTSPTFPFDVFLGYMVMSGTIVLLFSLVYLRDEIINNNWNPPWLIIPPQHNNNNNHHHHHHAAVVAPAEPGAQPAQPAAAGAAAAVPNPGLADFERIMRELQENHQHLLEAEARQRAADADPDSTSNLATSSTNKEVVNATDLSSSSALFPGVGRVLSESTIAATSAAAAGNSPDSVASSSHQHARWSDEETLTENEASRGANVVSPDGQQATSDAAVNVPPIAVAAVPPPVILHPPPAAVAAVVDDDAAELAAAIQPHNNNLNNVLNMNDDAAMQHILGLDGTFNFLEYAFWFGIICVVFLTFCVFGPWKVGSVVLSVVADNLLGAVNSVFSSSKASSSTATSMQPPALVADENFSNNVTNNSSSSDADPSTFIISSKPFFPFVGFNSSNIVAALLPTQLMLFNKLRLNENNMIHVVKVFSGYIVYAFGFRVLYDLLDPNNGIMKCRRLVQKLMNRNQQQHHQLQQQALAPADAAAAPIVGEQPDGAVAAAVAAAAPVPAQPAAVVRSSSDFQFLIGIGHVVVKLGILFFVEAAIHPAVFGYLMDICSLELFSAKFTSRLRAFEEAPLTSMFFHWLAGIVFISYFVWLMLVAREELRPGVLWFVRNYNEVNPLQQLAQWPVAKSLKNLSFVLVRGFFIVIVCFYLPTKILLWLLPTSFPFRVDQPDSEFFGELFLEFCLLHYVGPTLFNQVNMKKMVSRFVRIWARCVGKVLGLTGYLLGEPELVSQQADGDAAVAAAAAAGQPQHADGADDDDSESDDDDDDDADSDMDIDDDADNIPHAVPAAAAAAGAADAAPPVAAGGGGGNLGDDHDAVEFLLLTPARPVQPYTRPTYFSLRITGLLILLVITMSLGMCCIMAVPTLTGRFILSYWMNTGGSTSGSSAGVTVGGDDADSNITLSASSILVDGVRTITFGGAPLLSTLTAPHMKNNSVAMPARIHDLYAVITGICFIGLMFKLCSGLHWFIWNRLAAMRAAAAAAAAATTAAAATAAAAAANNNNIAADINVPAAPTIVAAGGATRVTTTGILPQFSTIVKYIVHTIKVVTAVLLLVGWLPFLVGLAIPELTLHTPFTVVVMEQTPVLRRLRSYCFGLLLSKITVTGIVLLAPEDYVWRQRFEIIAQNGIRNLHFGYIWHNVVWPLSRLLLTYLLVPYTLTKCWLWLQHFSIFASSSSVVTVTGVAGKMMTAETYARAARLLSCAHLNTFVLMVLGFAVIKAYRVAILLQNDIRKETYLVKTQLINLDQQQRAAAKSAAAAAAAAAGAIAPQN